MSEMPPAFKDKEDFPDLPPESVSELLMYK
jgi:hypothetical protein